MVETHSDCVLAIVGSRDVPDYQSESLVKQAILEHGPSVVISGGAKGVDKVAARVAMDLGVSIMEFIPREPTWDAPARGEPMETATDKGLVITVPGGFKQRNEKIAETADCLVRISSSTTKTYGSGWTADRAEALGKRVVRHTV